MKKAPIPKKIKKILKAHEDTRIDWYYWLRDDKRKNKQILSYLKKENKYRKAWFDQNKVSSKKIFNAYKNKLPKTEESFPRTIDSYKYFSTISISSEYRKFYRTFRNRKQLILDVNKLAKDKEFYSISGINPSRNHKFLAYGEDTNGRREYSVVVKDLDKEKIIERNPCSSSGGVIWNIDSSGYFYLKKDSRTLINDSLYFHELATDNSKDILIYKERDTEFNLSISLSRTKKRLFLQISKTESNEYRFLDLERNNFELTLFEKRKNKHLYYIDDSPEEFFILSNKNCNNNFVSIHVKIK